MFQRVPTFKLLTETPTRPLPGFPTICLQPFIRKLGLPPTGSSSHFLDLPHGHHGDRTAVKGHTGEKSRTTTLSSEALRAWTPSAAKVRRLSPECSWLKLNQHDWWLHDKQMRQKNDELWVLWANRVLGKGLKSLLAKQWLHSFDDMMPSWHTSNVKAGTSKAESSFCFLAPSVDATDQFRNRSSFNHDGNVTQNFENQVLERLTCQRKFVLIIWHIERTLEFPSVAVRKRPRIPHTQSSLRVYKAKAWKHQVLEVLQICITFKPSFEPYALIHNRRRPKLCFPSCGKAKCFKELTFPMSLKAKTWKPSLENWSRKKHIIEEE